MVKKIEILGMALDAYTAQDAMLLLEEHWDYAIMSTVENISMETLVKAHKDELIKNCIENLDLAIICDKGGGCDKAKDTGGGGKTIFSGVYDKDGL